MVSIVTLLDILIDSVRDFFHATEEQISYQISYQIELRNKNWNTEHKKA